jgi:predicted acetyltransferase
MTLLRLVNPSKAYEASYRSLLEEFRTRRERLIPFPLSFPHANFPELIARLEENSKGLGLPDGFVAHSTYWLVTGVSNLRHSLTPALRKEGGNIGYGIRPTARRQGYGSELLRRTLQKAKELGLAKVLLTCGKVNLASVKVILANGGVLESEEFVAKRNEVVQRYWIDLVQRNPSIQSGRPQAGAAELQR